MPVSSESGKRYIKDIVSRLPRQKMLDIGCGCGTYAKMFPDAHWTGVEIWEPYVEAYGLTSLYSSLYVEDARTWEPVAYYDVAFAGDVLEHMTAHEAKQLLEKLKACADTVVVRIPLGHHPQGECEGNPYETHVTDNWLDEQVQVTFGTPTLVHLDGYIGVYIWSKHTIKPKICVYAISKNEAHFVQRFCESAIDADLILIADTGSTDGLPEEAVKHGAVVHHISISPWRFDLARNAALALVPSDVDICISLDIDEVLTPGWREEVERAWKFGVTTRLRYLYDWGGGIKYYYEKIHAKHGYMWHHPCHEYPRPDGRIQEVWGQVDTLLVVHLPDPTKSRTYYIDLLALSVKEDPLCPRNAFYYARELSFNQRWQESINACKSYLALPGATWENERCYAYRVIGSCYEHLGNFAEAEKAYQMASSEAPNTREPWFQLANLMHAQQRWEECYAYATRALKIVNRDAVYTCDPEVWGYKLHDTAALAAWFIGLKDVAVKQGQIAIDLNPHDARLMTNLCYYRGDEPSKAHHVAGIPNIIHMMHFTGSKSRDFSFINYLAVKAAYDVQKPDAINFYYNEEPTNNPHWEAIKPYVHFRKISAPTEYEGVSLNDFPQYQADIVRLQVLRDEGGIYLDTDAILTKPLTEFLTDDCVMAGFVGDVSASTRYPDHSFSAATILARPQSEFVKIWLSELADGLRKGIWGWHVVCLPVEIYKKHPGLMTLVDMEKFLPFDWHDTRILEDDGDSIIPELLNAYVVHMWDSMWPDHLKVIDESYMFAGRTPFAKMFGKYAVQPAIAAE